MIQESIIKNDVILAFKKKIEKMNAHYKVSSITEIMVTLSIISIIIIAFNNRSFSLLKYAGLVFILLVFTKFVLVTKVSIELQKLRKFALKKQKALPADPFWSGVLGIVLPFAIYFAWAHGYKIYSKSEQFLYDLDPYEVWKELGLRLFKERPTIFD